MIIKTDWATKHPKSPYWSFEISLPDLAKQMTQEEVAELYLAKCGTNYPPDTCTCTKSVMSSDAYNSDGSKCLWCSVCGKPLSPKPQEYKINDGVCYVCGEKTNSLAGNPSEWAIYLAHIDGQTKHRYYHIKCLYPLLKNPSPKPQPEVPEVQFCYCGGGHFTPDHNLIKCLTCGRYIWKQRERGK
jgi:hypothetical protein